MKVLQINIFGNLSTGRIAVDLYNVLKNNGHQGLVAYARNTISAGIPHYVIGTKQNVYIDALHYCELLIGQGSFLKCNYKINRANQTI